MFNPYEETEVVMETIKSLLRGRELYYVHPEVSLGDRLFVIITRISKSEAVFSVELEFQDESTGYSAGELEIYAEKLAFDEWNYLCHFDSNDKDLNFLDDYIRNEGKYKSFEEVLASIEVDVLDTFKALKNQEAS